VRKLLIAGAVAGGFLLLGAPAHADVLPAPADAPGSDLGDLVTSAGTGLDPAGNLNLASPLDGRLVDVEPGDNSPDVDPRKLLPSAGADPAVQQAEAQPHDRPHRSGSAPQRGLTPQSGLPAADVVGGSLPMANGGLPVIGGLLGGGGVLGGGGLFGGLPAGGLQPGGLQPGGRMPDGRMPDGVQPGGEMPVGQSEAGPIGSGLPLLGGIAGALPGPATPGLTNPAIDPTDVSGMPPGGVPITPAGDEAPTQPADPDGQTTDPDPGNATDPGNGAGASTGATDDYNRLHEEPIDDEAAAQHTDTRPFSPVGRPVAGVDPGLR